MLVIGGDVMISIPAMFDELEKIAISRPMKEILRGTLSPAGQAKVRSVMRPEGVMAKGLERGSDALAQRHGIREHTLGFGDVAKRGLEVLRAKITGRKIPSVDTADMTAPFLSAIGGGGAAIGKDVFLDPKQRIIQMMAHGKRSLVKPKLSPGERDHLFQLIRRHEIDEARAFVNPKSFLHRGGTPWGAYQPVPLTRGHITQRQGGHFDPSVLVRESRNLASAPPAVQDVMRQLRGQIGETGLLAGAGMQYGRVNPLGTDVAKVLRRARQMQPEAIAPGSPISVSPELQSRAQDIARKVKGFVHPSR